MAQPSPFHVISLETFETHSWSTTQTPRRLLYRIRLPAVSKDVLQSFPVPSPKEPVNVTKGLSVRLRLRSWNAESALDYLGGDNRIMQVLESEGSFMKVKGLSELLWLWRMARIRSIIAALKTEEGDHGSKECGWC